MYRKEHRDIRVCVRGVSMMGGGAHLHIERGGIERDVCRHTHLFFSSMRAFEAASNSTAVILREGGESVSESLLRSRSLLMMRRSRLTLMPLRRGSSQGVPVGLCPSSPTSPPRCEGGWSVSAACTCAGGAGSFLGGSSCKIDMSPVV